MALALTAVANTQANRRFTFQIRGRAGLLRQHAAGAVVYLIALGLTAGALDVLSALAPSPVAPAGGGGARGGDDGGHGDAVRGAAQLGVRPAPAAPGIVRAAAR